MVFGHMQHTGDLLYAEKVISSMSIYDKARKKRREVEGNKFYVSRGCLWGDREKLSRSPGT